jgi:hypothetical protein
MAIRRRPAKCLVGWSVKYLRCSRSRPRPDCQRTGQRQRDTSSPNTAEPRGNARLPRRAGIAAPTVNSRPTAPRPRCGRCGSAASRLPTPWLIRADTGLSDHSCLFHPDCASENCRTQPSRSSSARTNASSSERGIATISTAGTRRPRATFQNGVCGKCSRQKTCHREMVRRSMSNSSASSRTRYPEGPCRMAATNTTTAPR